MTDVVPIPVALAHLDVNPAGVAVPWLHPTDDVRSYDARWGSCWIAAICRGCGFRLESRIVLLGSEKEAATWFEDPPLHAVCASYFAQIEEWEVRVLAEAWSAAYDEHGALLGGIPSGVVSRRERVRRG